MLLMKRFMVFLCIFLMISVFGFAQIDLQPVVIVNLSKTERIDVKQFKEYVNWETYQRIMYTQNNNTRLTDTEKREVLESIINLYLACQAAEKEGIKVDEKNINQEFDQSIKNFADQLAQMMGRRPTDAEIDAALLQRIGITRAGFKEIIRRSYISENYLKVKKKHLFDAIKPPTEAEIQAIYNQIKSKSILEGGCSRPVTVKVRMIIVQYPNASERTTAQNKANQLISQIGNDPGKFDETARDYIKPNSGYQTREGFLSKDERLRQTMGSTFMDTVFSLKQGSVSKVVELPDGFYIIKILETYSSKILLLDDIYLLEDPNSTTVRQAINISEIQRRGIIAYQQAQAELITELRKTGKFDIKNDIYDSITW